MCDRIIFNMEESADAANDIKHIHIAGRIIRENGVRIKVSGTDLKDAVSPGGKARGVVVEAVGQSGGNEPQKKRSEKKKAKHCAGGLTSMISQKETAAEEQQTER